MDELFGTHTVDLDHVHVMAGQVPVQVSRRFACPRTVSDRVAEGVLRSRDQQARLHGGRGGTSTAESGLNDVQSWLRRRMRQ